MVEEETELHLSGSTGKQWRGEHTILAKSRQGTLVRTNGWKTQARQGWGRASKVWNLSVELWPLCRRILVEATRPVKPGQPIVGYPILPVYRLASIPAREQPYSEGVSLSHDPGKLASHRRWNFARKCITPC